MTPQPPAGTPDAAPGPVWTRVPALEKELPGLFAAFSGATPRAPDAELAERLRKELRALGADEASPADWPMQPLLLMQRHTAQIAHLGDTERTGRNPRSHDQQSRAGLPLVGPLDGAAAALGGAGGLVGVKTADCVPVLAADIERGRYAALHAGWRGTALGILPNLLTHWLAAGSRTENLRLVLGPHIRGCCYEVGEDCLEQFTPQERAAGERTAGDLTGGAPHLELSAVLGVQAARSGLAPEQMEVSPHCTFCHQEADGTHPYASYRRARSEGGTLSLTNIALIGPLGLE